MAEHCVDVTGESFQREVLDASAQQPVLVDFWAPWCGPCRALAPVLEKLAAEFGGAFRLAKLNTDEHQEIAARYGVRGIPNVKAFVDGRMVNEFTGVLPEAGVRAFLAKVLPSPAEKTRREARARIGEGDFEKAESLLREALQAEPRLVAAQLDLAELLVARQDFAAAQHALESILAHDREERHERLSSQVSVRLRAEALPSLQDIAQRLERDPQDALSRIALAERLVAEMQFEAALEQLLMVVESVRDERRETARRIMLRVFTLASDQPDLIGPYRRRLAAALN